MQRACSEILQFPKYIHLTQCTKIMSLNTHGNSASCSTLCNAMNVDLESKVSFNCCLREVQRNFFAHNIIILLSPNIADNWNNQCIIIKDAISHL